MKNYTYAIAAALIASATVAVPVHAEFGVALDATSSTSVRNGQPATTVVGATVTTTEIEVTTNNRATTSLLVPTGAEMTASLQANDDRVDEVASDDNSIDVRYRVNGKFLGIFNATLPVVVEVDNDGSLEVDYPWYAFLYSSRPADLEAKVDAAARSDGSWNTETFTAQKRAEIIARVHAALKSSVDASASAEVNAR